MSSGKGSADVHESPRSVGQELREARERRAVSLADVSNALKISSVYLVALEMGRFEDLPSRVYAIGYVKSCASYLGLDTAALVARFRTELANAGISEPDYKASARIEDERSPEPEVRPKQDAKPSTTRLPSLSESAVSQAAVVIIIVGAVSYSLYQVTASIPVEVPVQVAAESSVSDHPIAQPLAADVPHNIHQAEPPSLREVSLRRPVLDLQLAIAEPRLLEFVAPVPLDLKELASSQSERVSPAERKEPRISAPTAMPIVQSDRVAVAQPVSVTVEGRAASLMPRLGQHYGEDTKYSRITLRLHRATAIRVADRRNRILIDRVLEAGDTFRVPDISGVRLSAVDGGAIEIILDNTTIGFAGRIGIPAREVSLEPKTIRRFARSR